MNHFNVQHYGGLATEMYICTAIGEDFVHIKSVYDIITEACDALGLKASFDKEEVPNNTDPNLDAVAITFRIVPSSEGALKLRSAYGSNIGLQRIYRSVWNWVSVLIAAEASVIANRE